MRKLHAAALMFILIGVATGSAAAENQSHSGDPRAGRQFAGYNCEACHVVAANQELRPLISGYAPSFPEIADRPGTTPEALRTFLHGQHGYSTMPYPDLAPTDLENVVAYIMSLRQRQ